jgi:DtxR family transcriptional regulator, Mn-dependent transcriptional regulator
VPVTSTVLTAAVVEHPQADLSPGGLPPADLPPADGRGAGPIVTEVLEVLLERDLGGDDLPPVTLVELVERIPVPATDVEAAVGHLGARADVELTATGIELTASGREHARTAVRRHRLVERMLADLVGLEWWKVHHEAARFDGVISADVEAKLIEQLGDPGTCPHGNPIPGSSNRLEHPDAVLLADAPVGPVHVVRITETLEGDDEALQLLQNCGFLPGRDAEVKDRRDGWVEVAGTVHDAAFPHHIAAHTYVAPR